MPVLRPLSTSKHVSIKFNLVTIVLIVSTANMYNMQKEQHKCVDPFGVFLKNIQNKGN